MPADTLITDPALLAVLASATEARKQCLQVIDLLPTTQQTDPPEDLVLAAKTLSARLALLRGLNRRAILAVRSTKTATTTSRQEVDSLLLSLQNLYYEQGHLLGEIRGCEEFEHVYATLPMVSEEEFRARAGPGSGGQEGEDVMMARIRDEHEARRELERQRAALMKVKEALVRETQGKKEELGRLDAEMEKWVRGADGIRGVFEEREKKLAEAVGS